MATAAERAKAAVQREHQMGSLSSENVRLQAQLTRTRRELSEARDYIEKLKAALALRAEDVGATAEMLQHLASENVSRVKFAEFMRENGELKEKLEGCKDLIAEITKTSAVAAKRLQAMQEESSRTAQELAESREALRGLDELRAQRDAALASLEEQASLREKLEAELASSREQVESLQVVQDDLLLEFGKLQDHCEALEARLVDAAGSTAASVSAGTAGASAAKDLAELRSRLETETRRYKELAETNHSLSIVVGQQRDEISALARARDLLQTIACILVSGDVEDRLARSECVRALRESDVPDVVRLMRALAPSPSGPVAAGSADSNSLSSATGLSGSRDSKSPGGSTSGDSLAYHGSGATKVASRDILDVSPVPRVEPSGPARYPAPRPVAGSQAAQTTQTTQTTQRRLPVRDPLDPTGLARTEPLPAAEADSILLDEELERVRSLADRIHQLNVEV